MASVYNSTRIPLIAAGTFVGSAENCSSHYSTCVSVITDQNSTLFLEYSTTGFHWDFSYSFPVVAGVSKVVVQDNRAQFYRLRLVNGSATVAQTYLRLSTIFKEASVNVNLDTSDSITVAHPVLDLLSTTTNQLNVNIGTSLEGAVTTMSVKLPSVIGRNIMTNSMSVALASDQPAIPTSNSVLQAVNYATEPTLAACKTRLEGTLAVNTISGFATETTLNACKTRLEGTLAVNTISGFATETTLSAVTAITSGNFWATPSTTVVVVALEASASVDLGNRSKVTVFAYWNSAGSQTLTVQWSPNNTNWFQETNQIIIANTTPYAQYFSTGGRYMRLVCANAGNLGVHVSAKM